MDEKRKVRSFSLGKLVLSNFGHEKIDDARTRRNENFTVQRLILLIVCREDSSRQRTSENSSIGRTRQVFAVRIDLKKKEIFFSFSFRREKNKPEDAPKFDGFVRCAIGFFAPPPKTPYHNLTAESLVDHFRFKSRYKVLQSSVDNA